MTRNRPSSRSSASTFRKSKTISPSIRSIATQSWAPRRRCAWSMKCTALAKVTAACNLPNDERVVKEKGSKRIMLKNVQDAKFNKTLIPISRVVLAPAQQNNLAFDAFFTHILMHELMHGLGPHNITVNGQSTTVRLELKDRYSSIEEAKADVTGLWALQYLIDKGVIEKEMQRTLYTT